MKHFTQKQEFNVHSKQNVKHTPPQLATVPVTLIITIQCVDFHNMQMNFLLQQPACC